MNATMETAAKLNSPVIIQFSNGGAAFNAGKGLNNDGQRAAILGGIAGAQHIHTLAAVSYTHLDVYKRQPSSFSILSMRMWFPLFPKTKNTEATFHATIFSASFRNILCSRRTEHCWWYR